MSYLTKAYRKRDDKFGAKSVERDMGGALFAGKEVEWKKSEYWRKMGVDQSRDPNQQQLNVVKSAGMLFVPMYQNPSTGAREELDANDKTTVVLGGVAREVGKEGIRVLHEELCEDIIEKSLEREAYLNDLVELVLIIGDDGTQALHPQLFNECKGTACLPSQIRVEVSADELSKRIRNLKNAVRIFMDKVVVPQSLLDKVHNKTKVKSVDHTMINSSTA